jgi:hypothetical protein
MKVQAAPGMKCPKEGKPRTYITESEAVDVPDTAFYRRMVADGSLVIATRTGKKEVTTNGQ